MIHKLTRGILLHHSGAGKIAFFISQIESGTNNNIMLFYHHHPRRNFFILLFDFLRERNWLRTLIYFFTTLPRPIPAYPKYENV